MSSSGEVKAVEVRNASDIDFVFPNGFSFFELYFQYFVRETLGAGGEAYVSRKFERNVDEIGQFMTSTHPGINKRWVKVALNEGERCFYVRLGKEIAGLGWLSIVNGIGRLHSLHVKAQFRRIGIGEDILFARLLWLKSKRARSAFSEISHDNSPSSRIAMKGHMTPSGTIFQYFKKDRGGEMDRKS